MTRILIAGVGNIFCGDDAFGVEVVTRLARRAALPRSVHVKDFGVKGLDLAYALADGYDFAVIVDAAARGQTPGTISVIEPEREEPSDSAPQALFVSTHGLDPEKVLSLVAAAGCECKRIVFVVCEPLTLGGENGAMGLSDAVAAAVEPAMHVVKRLTDSFLRGKDSRGTMEAATGEGSLS